MNLTITPYQILALDEAEQHTGSVISDLEQAVERAEQKAIVACGCGQEISRAEALTHDDMPGSYFCSEECRNDAEINSIAGEVAACGSYVDGRKAGAR